MVGPMLPAWYHEEKGIGTRTLVSPGWSTQNHFYLESDRHAWIAEAPAEEEIWKTFTVE